MGHMLAIQTVNGVTKLYISEKATAYDSKNAISVTLTISEPGVTYNFANFKAFRTTIDAAIGNVVLSRKLNEQY